MAVRRPLVIVSGDVAEVPSGDTIDSAVLESTIVAGSVGDTTHIPVLTYDAHGRLTAVTTAIITAGVSRAFPFFTT